MTIGFWIVAGAPGSKILAMAKAAKNKAAMKGAAINW